jgi:hypothetical protein
MLYILFDKLYTFTSFAARAIYIFAPIEQLEIILKYSKIKMHKLKNISMYEKSQYKSGNIVCCYSLLWQRTNNIPILHQI